MNLRRGNRNWVVLTLVLALSLSTLAAWANDPYIRDDNADTGIEPNPFGGNYWLSPDIWVRNTPDPNYDPNPYPIGSPTWTPQPHEDAEYDDPKTGFPAYVYVRVRNRGATATSGTERLRVYWAKASTGLSWDTDWVDYMDNTCGPTILHGMEITKTRKNASTVSDPERDAYITALLDIDANVALQFSDGVQYWDKQNTIHDIGGALHGVPGFLPWHREFLNRLEVLLRESDPLLTLLYWDWTTDPLTANGVNLFSTTFMGASNGAVGAPLLPLQPPNLTRGLGVFAFSPDSDASILGNGTYPSFRSDLENVPNHNSVHGFVGGPSGNISFLNTAAQDPFFFFLHGNVDRLWAQWQRDPTDPGRLDPSSTYGTSGTSTSITNNMNPWAGSLSPWSNPSEQALKSGLHDSVVSPPFYDVAPLVVPVLQPNEEVIIQVPWFPPDPADFSCFGDSGHFCLLARIETSTTAPFGMTFPEGVSVGTNAKNNNNIAWKNVTVVDNVPRLRFFRVQIVRNVLDAPALVRLRWYVPHETYDHDFWRYGQVRLTLPSYLAGRLRGGDLEPLGTNQLGTEYAIPRAGSYLDLQLDPRESFPVRLDFALAQGTPETVRKVPFEIDMAQVELQGGQEKTVMGGQRFTLDLSQLTLVDEGSEWAVLAEEVPPAEWTDPSYDDSDWVRGRAPFVHQGADAAAATHTTYFRRTFEAGGPEEYYAPRLRLLADDGAVVYLNGQEVYRHNLATEPIETKTAATAEVEGLEESVYWHQPIDVLPYLKAGENVLAVAVHQGAEDPDVRFDLELLANRTFPNVPPDVRIAQPADGAHFVVGDAVDVTADALDQDGTVRSVELFLDGKIIASAGSPPGEALLTGLAPGVHRIRARATDDAGATANHAVRITVAPSLPPVVEISSPAADGMFLEGQPIRVTANVLSSPSAPVARVDLYAKEGHLFATGLDLVNDSNYLPVDTATQPPYELDVPGLPAGMHMFQVGAVDQLGNVGASTHLMIHVHPSSKAIACDRRDVSGTCMSLRPAGDQDGDGVDNRFDVCPDSLLERPAENGWTAAERDEDGFRFTPPPGLEGIKAQAVTGYAELGGCACYQVRQALGLEVTAGDGCSAAMLQQFRQRFRAE